MAKRFIWLVGVAIVCLPRPVASQENPTGGRLNPWFKLTTHEAVSKGSMQTAEYPPDLAPPADLTPPADLVLDDVAPMETADPDVPTEVIWEPIGSGDPRNRWNDSWELGYVRLDYLQWWFDERPLPALVTASPNGTASPTAGILGNANTHVLFGGNDDVWDTPYGGRITAGIWLDDAHLMGVEGDWFALGADDQFHADYRSHAYVARPYFDDSQLVQAARLDAIPLDRQGAVRVDTDVDFQGAGVRLRRSLIPAAAQSGCSWGRVDFVAGYRFFRWDDSIQVEENFTVLNATGDGFPTGSSLVAHDLIYARNEFHGGDLGLLAEWHSGRFMVMAQSRLGLGNNHQEVGIRGDTTITVPGAAPFGYDRGLLAQPTNSGVFEDDEFVLVPEVNVELSFLVTCRTRVRVGYTFLYLSDIVQSADQIDPVIDSRLIPPDTVAPGATRPGRRFRKSSFWAQGINIGGEVRF